MGLRVTGLLSEVVKLEGDLVVRVKEAAITEVSMLRYQDLQKKHKEMDRDTCCYNDSLQPLMMTFLWVQ